MPQTTPIQWQIVTQVPRLPANEIHVWRIDLDRYPCRPDVMDEAERTRWQAMQHPLGAQRFCAMRTALRRLLGTYQHCAPAAVQIIIGEQGKPEIAGLTRPLYFNLSHTGHTAVIACRTAGPVGIDIECTRPTYSVRRIAERVFDSAYLATLQAAEYDPAVFLRLWVQWEAQQKCFGVGLLQRTHEQPPLACFAGHWDKGPLSVAWIKEENQPSMRFITIAPNHRDASSASEGL